MTSIAASWPIKKVQFLYTGQTGSIVILTPSANVVVERSERLVQGIK